MAEGTDLSQKVPLYYKHFLSLFLIGWHIPPYIMLFELSTSIFDDIYHSQSFLSPTHQTKQLKPDTVNQPLSPFHPKLRIVHKFIVYYFYNLSSEYSLSSANWITISNVPAASSIPPSPELFHTEHFCSLYASF
ncbi:hypothetical protein GJAV_G00043610 [Gymnothorax javanicus]|nr:hypothetical protein GJAV_G00043610 [Gymnothorax javanicus]